MFTNDTKRKSKQTMTHITQATTKEKQYNLQKYLYIFFSSEATLLKLVIYLITKTRLFKNTENFTNKKWKFSDKKILIFFIFLLKT